MSQYNDFRSSVSVANSETFCFISFQFFSSYSYDLTHNLQYNLAQTVRPTQGPIPPTESINKSKLNIWDICQDEENFLSSNTTTSPTTIITTSTSTSTSTTTTTTTASATSTKGGAGMMKISLIFKFSILGSMFSLFP